MIISEKQIIQLMDIGRAYAYLLEQGSELDNLIAKVVKRFIHEIIEQQSEELKVIE